MALLPRGDEECLILVAMTTWGTKYAPTTKLFFRARPCSPVTTPTPRVRQRSRLARFILSVCDAGGISGGGCTDRPSQHQQQRQHQHADEKKQFEVINIGDDRGLARNLFVERGHTVRVGT